MSTTETRDKLREEVATLRRQCAYRRAPMSQSIPEMIRYCQENEHNDPLLTPAKDNPFKEKKRCTMI